MPVTEFSARADAANEAADRLVPLQRRKEHIRHAAKTDMLLAAEGGVASATNANSFLLKLSAV